MSFRFQFISRFFGCQQQKLSNHIFYRFSTTYWLQFQTFLLNKSLFLHCCWSTQCVDFSKSGATESNMKMRLFWKNFQHHEQLVMPSCQSRAERQKGRLKADKSALETWSSAPLVVKQVFAFFLLHSRLCQKWLKYHQRSSSCQFPAVSNVYLTQELWVLNDIYVVVSMHQYWWRL